MPLARSSALFRDTATRVICNSSICPSERFVPGESFCSQFPIETVNENGERRTLNGERPKAHSGTLPENAAYSFERTGVKILKLPILGRGSQAEF